MKAIKRSRQFDIHFRTRIAPHPHLLKDFFANVEAFLDDPSLVGDHQLEGKMSLYRAFSVTEDHRVIYTQTPEYYLFQDIGTHAEVYLR